MPEPQPSPTIDDRYAIEPPGRRWVLNLETAGLSTLFHIVLLVVLGLTWKATVRLAGDDPEPLRTVELVAKRDTADGTVYVDQKAAEQAATPSDAPRGPIDVAQLLGGANQSPIDLAAALPKPAEAPGVGLAPAAATLGGGGLLDGPAPKTAPTLGRGRTKVYGLSGEGFKFVYVFDRSGSMGSSNNRPLDSAKRELLRSLQDLGDTHQFQIIFYNEEPSIMRLGPVTNLMFADAANKKAAERFVNAIVADGATQHEPAIMAALRMQPDVIFFLTDADQPGLSPAQLDRIQRINAGRTVINTIEFGPGPKIHKRNFLNDLADENHGQSVYIDVSGP